MNYPTEIFVDTDLVGAIDPPSYISERYIRSDFPELSLGEAAYNAYCQERDWKSVKGDPLPKFNEQSPDLRRSWQAAAKAVLKQAFSFFGNP